HEAGAPSQVASLVRAGREYVGDRSDETWAQLSHAVDHGLGDVVHDRAERQEGALKPEQKRARVDLDYSKAWSSRAEILTRVAHPECHLYAGEYLRGIATLQALPAEYEREGRIVWAAATWAIVTRFHIALGEFADAQETRRKAAALTERAGDPAWAIVHLL